MSTRAQSNPNRIACLRYVDYVRAHHPSLFSESMYVELFNASARDADECERALIMLKQADNNNRAVTSGRIMDPDATGLVPYTNLVWPLVGKYVVTSRFGNREDPMKPGTYRYHAGIDMSGQPSGSPVLAAAGGRVVDAGYNDRTGYTVRIMHGDDMMTEYHHMLQNLSVSVGSIVPAGRLIGGMGNTGQMSTGPHLHFGMMELRKLPDGSISGTYIDPIAYATNGRVVYDSRGARYNLPATISAAPRTTAPTVSRPARTARRPSLEPVSSGSGALIGLAVLAVAVGAGAVSNGSSQRQPTPKVSS